MQTLWRYVLQQALGTLIGVTLLVFVLLVYLAASIQEQLVNRQLQAVGASYSVVVNDRYRQLQDRLGQFAENSLVVNALIDFNGREAYLPSFIENLSLATSELVPLAIVDFSGQFIASNTEQNLDWFPTPDAWMQPVLNEGRAWHFFDQQTLYLAAPITIQGLPEGAMIASVPIRYLMQLPTFDTLEREFVLLDSRQQVLFSTHPTWQINSYLGFPVDDWIHSDLDSDLDRDLDSELNNTQALQPVVLQKPPRLALSAAFGFLLFISAVVVVGVFLVISFVTLTSVKKLLFELKAAMSADLQHYHSSNARQLTNQANVAELSEVVTIFHQSIASLQAVTTSKAEVQSIVDSLEAAVLITDSQYTLASCNQTAETLVQPSVGASLLHSLGLPDTSPLFATDAQCEQQRDGRHWLWSRSDKRDANGQRTGYVFVGTEITSIRQAERQLRLLKLAVDTASNGIIIAEYSVDQPLVFVNRGFEQITGYSAEQVLGRKCNFLQGPDTNADAVDQIRQAVRMCLPVQVEIENYRADGTVFWNQLSLSPVNNEYGETTHYIGIQADVSDRVHSENQLRQAMQEAESANRLKSQFVANMSHEIRTPMNAITGMAELCLATELSDKQRGYIEKIQLSSEALLAIINDILDFSKIEANKLQLDYHPFQLAKVLAASCAVFSDLSHSKSVPIWIDIDPVAPHHFIGDALRIQQILSNLLSNALKFTDRGQITVTVRYHKAWLTITVADTGIGITEAQLRQLFAAFQQADSSTSRRFGGTGLGLNISQRLAQLMGGNIAVTSQEGKGSVFVVELPMARVPQASTDGSTAWPCVALTITDPALAEHVRHILAYTGCTITDQIGDAERLLTDDALLAKALATKSLYIGLEDLTSASLAPPFTPFQLVDALLGNASASQSNEAGHVPQLQAKVLVAEDNDINRQIVTELLARCAIEPMHAVNGEEAVALALANDFDLILMDVQMPKKDGLQATKALRQQGVTTPIVALTANAMVSDRLASEQAGMNGHLAKPFKPHELFDLLRQQLGHLLVDDLAPVLPVAQQVSTQGMFDPSYALANAANSEPVLRQVVQSFVRDHAQDIHQAMQEMEEDIEAAHRRVHTLKGLLAMLTQDAIVGQVVEVEQQLKAAQMPDPTQLSGLAQSLARLVDELQQWLRQQ